LQLFRPPSGLLGDKMPLKTILSGKAARCSAKAKSTGTRCWRLASFKTPVCYVHGARRPETIRCEQNHWNFKTGQTTKAQRAKDHQMAIELRNLEALSFALGLAVGPKWLGRKPRAKHPHHRAETDPLIKFNIE
jgi:hypothetical protein